MVILLDSVPLLLLAHMTSACLQMDNITQNMAASKHHCGLGQQPWLWSGKCWREWADVGRTGKECVPGLLHGASSPGVLGRVAKMACHLTSFTLSQWSKDRVSTYVKSVLIHNNIWREGWGHAQLRFHVHISGYTYGIASLPVGGTTAARS